jgi:hypothetical protein
LPRYLADLAADGFDAGSVGCGCPVNAPPCCSAGRCQMGNACQGDGSPTDGGPPAAGDAGMNAVMPDASVDGGGGLFCLPLTPPDAGCLCDYSVPSIEGLACSPAGTSCGVGCKPHCVCSGGEWTFCVAPPCAPLPDF